MILLDTNLLVRVTNATDPHCDVARSAIHRMTGGGERLIIVPQNLYEFWAVATRRPGAQPAGQNGLGMTCEQASQWLAFFQRRFMLLPDRNDLSARWHDSAGRTAPVSTMTRRFWSSIRAMAGSLVIRCENGPAGRSVGGGKMYGRRSCLRPWARRW